MNTVMTVRRCPACGGSDARLVHRLALVTPDRHPLGDGYDVVSCLRCGTGFADAAPSRSYYEEYYAEQAKYGHEAATRNAGALDAQAAGEPAWVQDRFEAAAAHIEALVPGPDAAILDVGCATGSLLGALAKRGYRHLRGLDPSPQSSAVAAARGLRVEVGSLAEVPGGLGTFDCVCMTGVLEHLWDVDAAMRSLLGLLRPGGVVYASVPDASRYTDPYIAPFQDFSTEHVNHFSPATLAVLARRFGLQTVWSETADAHLGPASPCAGIAVAWRRLDQSGPAGREPLEACSPDRALVDSLDAFTSRSRRDFAALDTAVESQLAGESAFAVWGFGELTMKLLAAPALANRRLAAVIDANPARHGIEVGGVAVTAPACPPEPELPVVVGSLLGQESILAELARLGLPNRAVVLA